MGWENVDEPGSELAISSGFDIGVIELGDSVIYCCVGISV